MASTVVEKGGIGDPVLRKEDLRFISGRGNYTDDINRPGQTYAVIRRSDRPHAKIVSLDTGRTWRGGQAQVDVDPGRVGDRQAHAAPSRSRFPTIRAG